MIIFGKEFSSKRLVIALMLIKLLVGLVFIQSFPIDLDEPFTIFHSQQDLNDLLQMFENENNPPLHFLILHYWIKMFGISDLAVRIPSLIFSITTIPVLFQLSKKVLNVRAAVLVSLMFIFSTFNHYHSLEARAYSLFVFLSLYSFLLLYRIVFEKERKIFLYGLIIGLLLYTHYLAAIVIGVQFVLALIFFEKKSVKSFLQLGGAYIIALFLYIPGIILLVIRLNNFSAHGSWVNKPHWTELYGNVLRFMNGKYSFFLIIILVLIMFLRNRKNINLKLQKKEVFVLLGFVIPYVGMYLISLIFQPVFLDRYLLFTSPYLFLLFAICVSKISRDKDFYVFGGLIIVVFVALLEFVPQTNRDGDKIANVIRSSTEYDHVYFCPPHYDLTLAYHYDQEWFKNYKEFEQEKRKLNFSGIYTSEDIDLNERIEKMVYFLDLNSAFLYPDNNIKHSLENRFNLAETVKFKGGYTLYKFQ